MFKKIKDRIMRAKYEKQLKDVEKIILDPNISKKVQEVKEGTLSLPELWDHATFIIALYLRSHFNIADCDTSTEDKLIESVSNLSCGDNEKSSVARISCDVAKQSYELIKSIAEIRLFDDLISVAMYKGMVDITREKAPHLLEDASPQFFVHHLLMEDRTRDDIYEWEKKKDQEKTDDFPYNSDMAWEYVEFLETLSRAAQIYAWNNGIKDFENALYSEGFKAAIADEDFLYNGTVLKKLNPATGRTMKQSTFIDESEITDKNAPGIQAVYQKDKDGNPAGVRYAKFEEISVTIPKDPDYFGKYRRSGILEA